jgi:hypothetical protein
MNHPVTLTQLVSGNKQRNEANPRLQGHWLALARILWIALAILILILYVVGFPAALQYLKTVCVAAGCNGPQLTPEQARTLQSQGFTLSFFAMYLLAFELIFVVVWFLVATLIFWRKSTERLAWFVSLALLTFGAAFVDPLSVLTQQHSIWRWPGLVVSFIGVISLVLSLYLFPDGRFVPRWTSLVGIFWFPWNLYWLFFTGSMYTSLLWGFSYAGVLGLGVSAQIYRYLRVSNPTRRQQTKCLCWSSLCQLASLSYALAYGRSMRSSIARWSIAP